MKGACLQVCDDQCFVNTRRVRRVFHRSVRSHCIENPKHARNYQRNETERKTRVSHLSSLSLRREPHNDEYKENISFYAGNENKNHNQNHADTMRDTNSTGCGAATSPQHIPKLQRAMTLQFASWFQISIRSETFGVE